MQTIQLKPVDTKKSFYGKCTVLTGGSDKNSHIYYLKSYDTIVAEYDTITNIIMVHGWYSQTTARHINAFLAHFGFKQANKKEMENWQTYIN